MTKEIGGQILNAQGGIGTEIVLTGVTALIAEGVSECIDIRNLVTSDSYKALSNDKRNKKLGSELASSWTLNGILLETAGILGVAAIVYLQIKLRIFGTNDELRSAIENMF